MDTFGNYLVSSFAKLPSMHKMLAEGLSGHVVRLVRHAQGSRVIQTALSELSVESAKALTEELNGQVVECSLSTHGSWGVCIAFQLTLAPFILHQIAAHIFTLGTQQHGCRVVQSVVQAAALHGMDMRPVVDTVLRGDAESLAMHPYGNYAIQVTLKHVEPAMQAALVAELMPSVLLLSSDKHGSNVAETLLALASEEKLEEVRGQIYGVQPECSAALQELVAHPVRQLCAPGAFAPYRHRAARRVSRKDPAFLEPGQLWALGNHEVWRLR